MNDSELGKREIERDHLFLFLDSYEQVTGETFSLGDSETPDFIGLDGRKHKVGIEITQLRFSPSIRHMRSLFPPAAHDPDAWWELLGLMHQKKQTLTKGLWPQCDRKILMIMLIDTSIEVIASGSETDLPKQDDFTEIWLAGYAQVEPFGGVDLFAAVHPHLKGTFDVASRDRKPYG